MLRSWRLPVAVALALAPAGACRSRVAEPDGLGASVSSIGSAGPGSSPAIVRPVRLSGTPAARLVVVIVIDQLPTWSFDPILPRLDGGIARLAREGVYFASAELPYSNTYTAPGHAAIATGAPPRDSCIVANAWHRDGAARETTAIHDPTSPVLGALFGPGASSRNLCADGVADVLEAETGGAAHTVALSFKDRAAILVAGRRPDLAIWWDPDQAMMTTSRSYADRLPPWLDPATTQIQPATRFFAQTWRPSDPALLAELAASPSPGEGGIDGLGPTFPHSLAASEQPARAIRSTPFATRVLMETARAALHAESFGTDDVPDLLAISISSHDYAGHGWGQESWERIDVLLDIDRELGDFFAEIDRTVGADQWAAILTSDHGALPRAAVRPRVHLIDEAAVAQVAERAAVDALGPGPWVIGVSGNLLHLTPAFAALPDDRRVLGLDAMSLALAAIPGMGFVEPTRTLAGACDGPDGWRRRACQSFPPSSYDAVYVLPALGSQYLGGYPWGAAHGGGSPEERLVPLLVRDPSRPPGVAREPVSFLRIAPTVSHLLGVRPPPKATELPL